MRKNLPLSTRQLALAALLFTLSACANPSSCPSEQTDCSGQCVSISTEPDHCGSCSTVCAADQVCSQGSCSSGCTGSLINCSRSCVDATTDATNCGVCGMRCTAGATCQAGRCQAVVAECKSRLALQSSGAYDANLRTVQLSGRLTKNGKQVPDGSYRGWLQFVSKRGGARTMPTFSATGEATYAGELFVGTYDVLYWPSSSCRSGDALPCQQLLLRTDVQVTTADPLDFDVQTIQLAGRLTKNGAAVPTDTTDRGYLVFSLAAGGARVMTSFGTSGEATYMGELFAGVYDVSYQPSSSCRSGGAIPCQQMILRSKTELSNSGSLDLDVKTIKVAGRLTKNGAAVPDDFIDRGNVVFALQNGSARTLTSFGTIGEATYMSELFAGTYDVRYQPSSSCRSGGALPCQQATLNSRIALSTSGALDLDAKTVQASGTLTKNGVTVPDDLSDRGSLVFSLLNGGARSLPSFGVNGEATYMAELFAGTYDVSYQPSPSCRSGGAMPCQQLILSTKAALATSGALDFDAKTIQITGKLTKNGVTIPDDTTDRGSLVFSLRNGSPRALTSFGTSGEAAYMAEVFAGTYDVRYQPSPSCRSGGALPCQQTALRSATVLSASGALDLDVKTLTIAGMLTKNGAALPADTTDRGYFVFTLAEGGSRAMPTFGASGAASYQGELFTGSYDINYQPSGSCRSGGALPCQSFLVIGCPPGSM